MTEPEARRYEICHLFLSPLKSESRLFKELATAEKLFPAETLLSIGLDKEEGELSGLLQGRYPFERIRLWTAGLPKSLPFQLIKYLEWTLRAAWRARRSGVQILHCHSLAPLFAAVIASLFGGPRILYDAHELESRRAGFSSTKARIAALYERILLQFVEEIMVVSPSIRIYYTKEFPNKSINLLMNVPSVEKGNGENIRDQFNISPDEVLVIYVGGFSNGRGVDLLLRAFSDLGERYHLVFMGGGVLLDDIEKFSKGRNIYIKSPVVERDVVPTIRHADVSFSVNDCESLNHQYSLPNKFFQSLMAGVPVMVNIQNVDMLSVGKESGMVFGVEYDVDAIRHFIERFPERKVPCEPQDFSWESQEDVLLSAYRRVLGENSTLQN